MVDQRRRGPLGTLLGELPARQHRAETMKLRPRRRRALLCVGHVRA
jgi:hypothetical protein